MGWWCWCLAWGVAVSLWAQETRSGWLASAGAWFDRACVRWDPDQWNGLEQFLLKVEPTEPEERKSWLYWVGVSRFHAFLCRHSQEGALAAELREEELLKVLGTWEELLRLDPYHAEAHAMAATLLGMRVSGSPWRTLRWGPAIQRHQRAALQWGGHNPRVLYLYGVALWKTARSAEAVVRAAEVLRNAEQRFVAEAGRSPAPGEPRWGYVDCLAFLGRVEEQLGRLAEARDAYRRALQVHPGHRLARERLARLGEP